MNHRALPSLHVASRRPDKHTCPKADALQIARRTRAPPPTPTTLKRNRREVGIADSASTAERKSNSGEKSAKVYVTKLQTMGDQAGGQPSRNVGSASREQAKINASRCRSSSHHSRCRTAAAAIRLPSFAKSSKSAGAARRPHSSSCRRPGGKAPPPLRILHNCGAIRASACNKKAHWRTKPRKRHHPHIPLVAWIRAGENPKRQRW